MTTTSTTSRCAPDSKRHATVWLLEALQASNYKRMSQPLALSRPTAVWLPTNAVCFNIAIACEQQKLLLKPEHDRNGT